MNNDVTVNIALKEFPHFVESRKKNEKEILGDMYPIKMDLVHMQMGINGEAGELTDCIKKHVVYGQEFDRKNCIEEIGDTLYYLQGLCNILGTTLESCITHNMLKLKKRYPNQYTDHAALMRKDKIL